MLLFFLSGTFYFLRQSDLSKTSFSRSLRFSVFWHSYIRYSNVSLYFLLNLHSHSSNIVFYFFRFLICILQLILCSSHSLLWLLCNSLVIILRQSELYGDFLIFVFWSWSCISQSLCVISGIILWRSFLFLLTSVIAYPFFFLIIFSPFFSYLLNPSLCTSLQSCCTLHSKEQLQDVSIFSCTFRLLQSFTVPFQLCSWFIRYLINII